MCRLQKKERHHYVWQKYLSPWTRDGGIYYKRGEKILETGTPAIAVEKLLYQLKIMSIRDIQIARRLSVEGIVIPRLKAMAEGWFDLFIKAQSILMRADRIDDLPPVLKKEVEALESSFEEEIHTKVEHDAIHALDRLRQGDLSVLESLHDMLGLCMFMGFQYMRTRKIAAKTVEALEGIPDFNVSASLGILRIIFGWSLGANLLLCLENKRWRVELLKAQNGSEFITSDQPIINLAASEGDVTPPTEFRAFFPLSPQLAIVIDFNSDEPGTTTSEIAVDEVDRWNRVLYANSHEEVYSRSKSALEGL